MTFRISFFFISSLWTEYKLFDYFYRNNFLSRKFKSVMSNMNGPGYNQNKIDDVGDVERIIKIKPSFLSSRPARISAPPLSPIKLSSKSTSCKHLELSINLQTNEIIFNILTFFLKVFYWNNHSKIKNSWFRIFNRIQTKI